MKTVNLDHLSASPILPEVRDEMLPFLSQEYGNPLSRHSMGTNPRKALEEARGALAGLIGASAQELVFTSCASESNNLAIKGVALAHSKKGRHIIASPIEHHSVIHPLKSLERQGWEISWLHVDDKGRVDPREVDSLVRRDTCLITVTSASNEIGTIEPIKEIGINAREKGVLFHTDAAACVGNIPIDVRDLCVDLLSLAGNTFYGPPGSGALYVRQGVKIFPIIEGGVQEGGLRAGTQSVAAIVGMGAAAKLANKMLSGRSAHLITLREAMIEGVLGGVPDSFLTGDRQMRLPGHASFCIKFIEGESILMHLNSLGLSGTSGSTCSSEALRLSHVLEAIGVDPVWAQGSVTFTVGLDNTIEDVESLVKNLPIVVGKLRQMSPLT